MSVTHYEASLRAEPNKTTAIQPCRFCGEAHKLQIDEGSIEVLWAISDDGTVLRGPTGQPIDAPHEDHVTCETCDAQAPLKVWNATPAWMKTRAANIAAADAEYDDDGVWIGARQ
ncbi:MAG: hypothetical protein ACRED4_09550 [Brevundimonas sp.]